MIHKVVDLNSSLVIDNIQNMIKLESYHKISSSVNIKIHFELQASSAMGTFENPSSKNHQYPKTNKNSLRKDFISSTLGFHMFRPPPWTLKSNIGKLCFFPYPTQISIQLLSPKGSGFQNLV